jgi:hypothetical protein
MAVSLVDRAEILMKHPLCGFAIHRRDEDDVTLVASYVFEVLHKEGLERSVPMLPVGLNFGIRSGQLVHQALDQLALRLVDRDDANGSINPPSHKRRRFSNDGARLHWIAALACLVPAVGDLLAGDAEIGIIENRTWINEKPIVIELAVGIGDQRLVNSTRIT